GATGVRVHPPFKSREAKDFVFMANDVSSERRVERMVEVIAEEMQAIQARSGRTIVVAGPVVVHTGGAAHLGRLIRAGYVQALLSGNALAVHDIESALFGTSLGISVETGRVVEGGHHHHMRAINAIRRAGGIRQAVAAGE